MKFDTFERGRDASQASLLLDARYARYAARCNSPCLTAAELETEGQKLAGVQINVSHKIDAVCADIAQHALSLIQLDRQVALEPLVSAFVHEEV